MMRALWALVPACTFATELPAEEAPGLDPNTPQPTPATRCQASGLALCVEFEDMPNPADGIAPAAIITSMNVLPQLRFADETAAQLAPMSLVKIDDIQKLDIPTNLTIEMWTKPSERPDEDEQFGLFDNHQQYAMSFEADGEIECNLAGESLDSRVALAINAWHHVACTFDGSELRVYVDGKLQGCESLTPTVSIGGTLGSAIGANMDIGPTYKDRFVGQLDNVHVYNRTLGAADICTLWGNGNCSDTCPPSGNSGSGGGGGGGGWNDDND
jgi:hypothetical protein